MSTRMQNLDEAVLYSISLKNLLLTTDDGSVLDVTFALSHGRASYVIFEHLVRKVTGLNRGSKFIDHEDLNGFKYEQKSYKDPKSFKRSKGNIHTAASTVFANNSRAKEVKDAIDSGDYERALQV